MHELSIAMNIVEIVTDETTKAGSPKVLEIDLEVGTLSGVDKEALEFAMESAVIGTVADQARISILQIHALAQCNQCRQTFAVEDLFTCCPDCQSYDTRLIKGDELRIKSILVE